MVKNSNDNRTLPEVFRELQEIRNAQLKSYKTDKLNNKNIFKSAINMMATKKINVASIIVLIFMAITVSTGYIFANNIEQENVEIVGEYEENNNIVNVENVISKNISVVTSKELVTEQREVKHKIVYRENDLLPKDEQVVIQEGINGKEEVTVVKRYENNEFIDENIINRKLLEESTEEIIEVGTSEYLKKFNVHIGEKMYLLTQAELRQSSSEDSLNICTIPQNLDVKLLDISDNWCKVSFDLNEGYIKKDVLTSETINPELAEACRILRIKQNLDINMELNKPSGLTKEDFIKILSGNSSDKNKVFEQNAEVFYEMEQKYNINGVFLAAIGIHESNWGKSVIAKDKKNLFGYGSYDRNPYEYSYEFGLYEESIELVAKVLVKYYLNQEGTPIYDGELAKGSYYNGSTVEGVNVRYASDDNWSNRVYSIMEDLYNKL